MSSVTPPPQDPLAGRGVYADAPTGELGEPLLPRWFAVLGVLSVVAAIVVGVWALLAGSPPQIAVAERRPPPADGFTTAVGEINVGNSAPSGDAVTGCPDGIGVAGSPADIDRLQRALAGLCAAADAETAARLEEFAELSGSIRFAQFAFTGVDSTLAPNGVDARSSNPTILINARWSRSDTNVLWIAPLIAHDVTWLEFPTGSVEGALAARRAEARICDTAVPADDLSRGCEDAAGVLALEDPRSALTDAGFSNS